MDFALESHYSDPAIISSWQAQEEPNSILLHTNILTDCLCWICTGVKNELTIKLSQKRFAADLNAGAFCHCLGYSRLFVSNMSLESIDVKAWKNAAQKPGNLLLTMYQ